MNVNLLNVIQLLLMTFQTMNIPQTSINNDDLRLKNSIENILLNAINESAGVELIEDTLHFEEPYKDTEMEIIEDNECTSAIQESKARDDACSVDEESVNYDYKSRALEYWRSEKFRKVQSIRQLRRWAHQLNQDGTHKEKIARICSSTLENSKTAVDA
ncbi:hypothetical protein PV325_004498 [Microctonus aethiopoides]|nr:hypothetical protein PV325_004498 [Microctonus aethiopoides]